MCGKFTAMASWTRMVEFAEAVLAQRAPGTGDQDADDPQITFRVMSSLPVIVWDAEEKCRRVVAMRWGFPHPSDWRRPQPIHARAETIDSTRVFADAFREGQRGIVMVKNFNEAPNFEKEGLGGQGGGEQHTITPGDEAPLGIAFVWRRFQLEGIPLPLFACVMVTVPANALIAALPTDRMPAVLAPEDWSIWLGEEPASPDALKACLKTVEGVRWTMTREERAAKTKRQKPTQSDPGGLF